MQDSDGETNFSELVTARNRKQRKSGGWQSMGLHYTIFKGIERKGYRQPTPVQRKTIPAILDGKDVVGMSRTGSGKTAAFVIPMLQRLRARDTKGARALIVEPTRELATQTLKVVKELARFTDLSCNSIVGGDLIEEQFASVHQKPDIIIATPGRLLHIIVEMNLQFPTIEYVVFDEADRLFEMGFAQQIQEILKRLSLNRQTLLFSATLPKMLIDFAKADLSNPTLIRLDVDEKLNDRLSMDFVFCRAEDKIAALLYLLRVHSRRNEQIIVFCATMKLVEYLAGVVKESGMDCVFLYSQLDAVARKMNMERFRRKEQNILIVTDIAARGVDIPILDTVINFDFPPKAKLFVHRVGRVARVERRGRAISLFNADELAYLVDLYLFLGRPLKFAAAGDVGQGISSDEVIIGKASDELLQTESESLCKMLEYSAELVELDKKARNATNKYKRTRPQASAESVKRVKKELRDALSSCAVHPIFQAETQTENERSKLIRELSTLKSKMTIFEVNSGSKALPAAIMKSKRKRHQKFLKNRVNNDEPILDEPSTIKLNIDDQLASESDLKDVFGTVIGPTKWTSNTSQSKKARKMDEHQREKLQHFVSYAPKDLVSERALAVDRGFDTAAKASEIEICADDETDLHNRFNKKVWDRKRKRFVGTAGNDPTRKKIKTEDGTKLPASYRSGRYEKWQKKQKFTHRDVDDGEDEDRIVNGGKRWTKNGGRNDKRKNISDVRRSELKNSDEILKERLRKQRIKDFQAYRRKVNRSKK